MALATQSCPFDKIEQLSYGQIVREGFHSQVTIFRYEDNFTNNVSCITFFPDKMSVRFKRQDKF